MVRVLPFAWNLWAARQHERRFVAFCYNYGVTFRSVRAAAQRLSRHIAMFTALLLLIAMGFSWIL
jgi:hypothetical protein